MIDRTLEKKLRVLAGYCPVIMVADHRLSGKTTLRRMSYPEHRMSHWKRLTPETLPSNFPRSFFAQYAGGANIDEIQHAPMLICLKSEIDAPPDTGRFGMTGSQHFGFCPKPSPGQCLANVASMCCRHLI